jgi:plastocyanin
MLRTGLSLAVMALVAFPGAALAVDQTVTATGGNDFVPAEVTVSAGEKVTWTNAGGTHNVRFADGLFDQPANPIPPPWPLVERRFELAGDYDYLCEQHASVMTGTVHVVPAGTPPVSPPGTSPPGTSPPGADPPGAGPPGAPGPDPAPTLAALRITLRVSDATPTAGRRVRLFGLVRPARDGRKVQIQRRIRGAAYRTVASAHLRDAGAAKSRFSVQLRLSGDAVLRARVAGDDERAAGVSASRTIDVKPRPRR